MIFALTSPCSRFTTAFAFESFSICWKQGRHRKGPLPEASIGGISCCNSLAPSFRDSNTALEDGPYNLLLFEALGSSCRQRKQLILQLVFTNNSRVRVDLSAKLRSRSELRKVWSYHVTARISLALSKFQ